MGAAACTILWGVSSSEEVVKAILGGVSALRGGWARELRCCHAESAVPLLGRPQTRPARFARQVVVESQLCRVRGNLDLGRQIKGVSALLPQSLHPESAWCGGGSSTSSMYMSQTVKCFYIPYFQA